MKFCCLINTYSGNKNGVRILEELEKDCLLNIEKIILLTPDNFDKGLEEAEQFENAPGVSNPLAFLYVVNL